MAKFEENNLREEEKSGRFEPGTPDDETLKLDQLDSYPGVLPNFDGLENSDEPTLEEQLDIDIDKPKTEEESSEVSENKKEENQAQKEERIEDEPQEEVINQETKTEGSQQEESPEEETPTKEVSPEAKDTSVNPDQSSVWELFDENENAENIDSQKNIDEKISSDDEEISTEDDIDLNPEENITKTAENAIALDDEIIDVLEDDLAKSKVEKQGKVEEEVIKEEDFDFHSIDEDEDAKEIDLMSLEADRPSTFKVSEEKPELEEIPEEKPKKTKKDKSKKVKPRKEKKKKDKKKIIVYAATIFAALLFAALLYDWGINRGGFSDIFGIGKEHKRTTQIAKEHLTEKKKHKISLKEEIKITKPQESFAGKTDTLIGKKEIEKNELKHKVVNKIKKAKLLAKLQKKKENYETTHRKINYKTNNENFTEEDTLQMSDIISPEFTKINFEDSETKHLDKSYNGNKEAVFVVQIYASPSKSDAMDWLNDLKSKGVTNARITQQMLRGIIWYRVRFGHFASEEEAKNAAKRLGFSRSWIDRIK